MANPDFCGSSNNTPSWTLWNVIEWQFGFRTGLNKNFLLKFKNKWVRHNKPFITSNAKTYKFPPELLAGICWIEVGGDPEFIDRFAFYVRTFDWSGPDWVDNHLTITKHPERTSFGAVSMQLRTAVKTLGLNPASVNHGELSQLADCLQVDVYNIGLVARHLRQIIDLDKLQDNPPELNETAIKVAGARYNRGLEPSLEEIKKNTSYGDFILKRWQLLSELLK